MDLHAQDAALVTDLRRLLQRLNEMPDDREPRLTPLGARVQEHLGVDPTALPLVAEHIPPHRLVDADLALDDLASGDERAEVLGISGGQERQHEDFTSMLRHRYASFGTDAPVEYGSAATGPRSTRQVLAMGLRLFAFEGRPVAVLQRDAKPMFGRETAIVEILTGDAETTGTFLATLRRRMNEVSVVRGNVVSFGHSEYGQGVGRMTFLERPSVTAADVVLPDGVLQRIRDHVVGIAEHADDLRARGQHLKRGVLLYGPPGTGKTLTVRHLLHETPQTTAVLLQGGALGLVGEAARLARAMTPSIVVLEDVDLVAAERGMFGIQPLLFEVLDALDGLDGDADVAFILTTNRADILEPALAARPGRVDLAVEIPLPDAGARRALFRVYAAGLPLSDDALDAAADRAEGVTASFAKELIRRAVLHATLQGHEVGDADLDAALTEMLEAAQGISKALFGGEGTDPGPPAGFGAEEGASFGWVASQPLAGRMFGDVAPGFGADDADEVPDTDEHDR
jgi:hypothetical protein